MEKRIARRIASAERRAAREGRQKEAQARSAANQATMSARMDLDARFRRFALDFDTKLQRAIAK